MIIKKYSWKQKINLKNINFNLGYKIIKNNKLGYKGFINIGNCNIIIIQHVI